MIVMNVYWEIGPRVSQKKKKKKERLMDFMKNGEEEKQQWVRVFVHRLSSNI